MLAMAIPSNRYLNVQAALNTMRKILTSCPQQNIFMFFPSYLYSNLIGFVKDPYTTEIIYRLLIYFIKELENPKQAMDSA